jgi:hypothetical protein
MKKELLHLQPSNRKLWLYSLVLMAPIVLLHIAHFSMGAFNSQHLPTGFIHYDMPYYMANAREYKEAESFSILFRLPFSPDYSNNPIYFYPQLLLMGLILKFTAIDPPALLLGFGFVFGVLTIRICIKLLTSITDLPVKLFPLISILLIYGGGLIFVTGFFLKLLHGNASIAWEEAFYLDPGNGWWFLNIGRNFTTPLESYYHFLFFVTVYYISKSKLMPAVLCATLLSLSHPFTGVLILSIVCTWFFFEKVIANNKTIKWATVFVIATATTWFAIYNFLLLPQDSDHKALMSEWMVNFSANPKSFFLGYILVAIPAIIRLSSLDKIKAFIKSPFHRFLLIWLLVNLFWENHNLFMTARQPAHFTRGYVWACLFIIGLPVIIRFLSSLTAERGLLSAKAALTAVVLLALSDNIAWFMHQSIIQYKGAGHYTSADQKNVLNFLSENYKKNELLISADEKISYLGTTYTPYRSSYSHKYNTPHPKVAKAKTIEFLNNYGKVNFTNRKIVVVVRNDSTANYWRPEFDSVYSNKSYMIWRRKGY